MAQAVATSLHTIDAVLQQRESNLAAAGRWGTIDSILHQRVQAALPAAAAAGEVLGDALASGVADGISAGGPAVAEALEEVVQRASELFPSALAAALEQEQLVDRIGEAGGALMAAVRVALEEGGQQNVDTVTQAAISIIDTLEDRLSPEQAQVLGGQLMSALSTAMTDGGAAAVQAVVDVLAQIAAALEVPPVDLGRVLRESFEMVFRDEGFVASFGQAGGELMQSLMEAIEEGGASSVQAVGRQAAELIVELNEVLDPETAAWVADNFMSALALAIETGGEKGVDAVAFWLERVDALLTEAPASWSESLAAALAASELEEQIGSAGFRLMEVLGETLEEGGQQNVQRLSEMAVDMLETMGEELDPAQATFFGDQLMAALADALSGGGEAAVQAVIDILGEIDALLEAPEVIDSAQTLKDTIAGMFADERLKQKVGEDGFDIMEALQLAIDTGGERGIEAMSRTVFAMLGELDELDSAQATGLGAKLMGALQVALQTGGEKAVAEVQTILGQINELLSGAPVDIPVPGGGGTPPVPFSEQLQSLLSGTQINAVAALLDKPYSQVASARREDIVAQLNALAKQIGVPGVIAQIEHDRFVAPDNIESLLNLLRPFGLSFQAGAWEIPANVSAALHRDEMVVPASLAESLRRRFSGFAEMFGTLTPAPTSLADLLGGAAATAGVAPLPLATAATVNVSAPFSLQFQGIDWGLVRQTVRAEIDDMLGGARSEALRAGVPLRSGVG